MDGAEEDGRGLMEPERIGLPHILYMISECCRQDAQRITPTIAGGRHCAGLFRAVYKLQRPSGGRQDRRTTTLYPVVPEPGCSSRWLDGDLIGQKAPVSQPHRLSASTSAAVSRFKFSWPGRRRGEHRRAARDNPAGPGASGQLLRVACLG